MRDLLGVPYFEVLRVPYFRKPPWREGGEGKEEYYTKISRAVALKKKATKKQSRLDMNRSYYSCYCYCISLLQVRELLLRLFHVPDGKFYHCSYKRKSKANITSIA